MIIELKTAVVVRAPGQADTTLPVGRKVNYSSRNDGEKRIHKLTSLERGRLVKYQETTSKFETPPWL